MGRDRAANREFRKITRDKSKSRNHKTLVTATMAVEVQQLSHKPARQIVIKPKNENQSRYLASIRNNIITYGLGCAGTGKTWLAAILAAEEFKEGLIDSIIVTRPTVEVGESMGYRPGEDSEKYEPYFRPVRDALVESLGSGALEYHLKSGAIEARPLQLLRGATLKNCWVIADEMQNATPEQVKMLLTRIGENCKIIMNGDIKQCDLPAGAISGLSHSLEKMRGRVSSFGVVKFNAADIVRHGIVREIVMAYDG